MVKLENKGFDRVIPCVRSDKLVVGLFVLVDGADTDSGIAVLLSGSVSSSEPH